MQERKPLSKHETEKAQRRSQRGPYDPAVSPTPWSAEGLNILDAHGWVIGNAVGTRTSGDPAASKKEHERDLRNAKLFAEASTLKEENARLKDALLVKHAVIDSMREGSMKDGEHLVKLYDRFTAENERLRSLLGNIGKPGYVVRIEDGWLWDRNGNKVESIDSFLKGASTPALHGEGYCVSKIKHDARLDDLREAKADLLAALKMVVDSYSFDRLGPGTKLAIDAAIAKHGGGA